MGVTRPTAWLRTAVLAAATALSLAACATAPAPRGAGGLMAGHLADGRPRAFNRPYQVRGRWYVPVDQPGYDQVGLASWYSYESSSGRTADGERFDARVATAAHTTLPIPSWLEVTNLDNGRSARVRLNDRGPFVPGRILDVSKAAAQSLGFLGRGTARVRVRYLGPAGLYPGDPPVWAGVQPSRPPRTPPQRYAALVGPRATLRRGSARDEVRADVLNAPVEAITPADTLDPPDASSPPVAPAAGEATTFAVQAGAFGDRRNAERAARQLGEAGHATILTAPRRDGGVLYRVVVGGWSQAQDAASARTRIAALGFADARVVTP